MKIFSEFNRRKFINGRSINFVKVQMSTTLKFHGLDARLKWPIQIKINSIDYIADKMPKIYIIVVYHLERLNDYAETNVITE